MPISFGGGKHKCSGNAFALFQIKAIFCVLLREYEFELCEPADTYVDDYTQMIVQPKAPCRVRYKKIKQAAIAKSPVKKTAKKSVKKLSKNSEKTFRIVVDRQLCQGHGVCVGEAPELFSLDSTGNLIAKDEDSTPNLLKKAKKAAEFCPNNALSINENTTEK